jgi:hypothetical protein
MRDPNLSSEYTSNANVEIETLSNNSLPTGNVKLGKRSVNGSVSNDPELLPVKLLEEGIKRVR